jgi:hypothetical protein
MYRRISIALLALAVSVPLSFAQRRGGMGRPASGGHARFARGGAGSAGLHRGRWPLSGDGLLGYPFVYSDYGSDSIDSYLPGSYDESEAPHVVVVPPRSARVAPRQTRLAPLLIEWHGDRYVRFGGAAVKDESGAAVHPDYAEPANTRSAVSPLKVQPPTVLVYRDGHREEIPDYAIADGVIYVRGSDWQSGGWTKRIPLAALDAAATVQANQERGAKFMLPSASNVVIASF